VKPTARSLARTYSTRAYADPWEKVEDYHRVQEFTAERPKAGRTKVGNALELPPSRVRGWIGDSMPDSVRGINTAVAHGWLEPSPDSAEAAGLVQLAAHVISGGSINQTWVPAVAVGRNAPADWIQNGFRLVGVKTTTRHENSDSRATEILPTDDASVLGRCLTCLGVPRGAKNDLTSLPDALDIVPESVRREYARITVRHRAVRFDEKETARINLSRDTGYHEALAAFLRNVTGENVTAGNRGVTVSADAVRALDLEDQ
jgi:hypothetical protein